MYNCLMQKALATLALSLVIGLPLAAFAQSSSTQSICALSHTLVRGNQGTDVSTLQLFLSEQGFFTAQASGYFGFITESALVQFQLQNGIITSIVLGGVYGVRTRAYVNSHWCGTSATNTPPPVTECPAIPLVPSTPPCTGTWLKINDSNNCHVGWSCTEPTKAATVAIPNPDQPPIINAIIGPTTLKQNESGTWKISAIDPEHTQITYSVVWGDEGTSISQLLDIAGQGTNFSPSTSYTHTYTQSGLFNIIVFAHDSGGNTTKATLTLTVQSPPPPPAAAQTNTNIDTNGGAGSSNTNATASCFDQWWGTTLPHGQTRCNIDPRSRIAICPASAKQVCQNGQWVSVTQTTTGASCNFGGHTYADGTVLPNASDCTGIGGLCGWTTANLYMCRRGAFEWETCFGGNMIGPTAAGCSGVPINPQPPAPTNASPGGYWCGAGQQSVWSATPCLNNLNS